MASRRASEKLMTAGKVKVNGMVVKELGTKVDDERDIVSVQGKVIYKPMMVKDETGQSMRHHRKVYLMLNKPVGYVTTSSDELGRKTIMELLEEAKKQYGGAEYGGRLFAVGRLDQDTSGLLLITNDGDWAQKITHPSFSVVKTYIAVVGGGEWTANEKTRFTSGLRLGARAAKLTAPAELRLLERRSDGTRKVEIKIAEGQNHQVRRMCLAVNHPVFKLERVAVGLLKLGELKKGQWRELSPSEVESVVS